MRAFVIADASKRKARPVAALFWEGGAAGRDGDFFIELASGVDEGDLPLSLLFCLRFDGGRASCEESGDWVRSRIVPENRHNIVEVLRANGLVEYDAVSLLANSKGRSSDDDFLAYEVPLSEQLACELRDCSESRADRLIAAVERRRDGADVHYAVVELPSEATLDGDSSEGAVPEGKSAAASIGDQIRERRRKAGLTQKQLAARAGITQAVLSRVESGAGNPTLALLEELAFALDLRLDVSLKNE